MVRTLPFNERRKTNRELAEFVSPTEPNRSADSGGPRGRQRLSMVGIGHQIASGHSFKLTTIQLLLLQPRIVHILRNVVHQLTSTCAALLNAMPFTTGAVPREKGIMPVLSLILSMLNSGHFGLCNVTVQIVVVLRRQSAICHILYVQRQ